MERRDRTYYRFVWFEQRGWWFKAFDECFGPYEQIAEAQHNLWMIQILSRRLQNELHKPRRLPS